jgi:succinyl-diaminopimelate desuccinylase
MDNILNNYIDTIKDKIINSTCEIINIPSVFDDNDGSNTPFGLNTVKALEYVLDLGKSLGFKTKNIDNKCGYIEFGHGDKLLGIIGHLDVVPANEKDGWTTPPFKATVLNNNIYGRGAIDDKGPVIATLYAMKAVKDNYNLDKRVRLILGINEENDWKCIERYKETEEMPNISFSPDANFPCIYAEKTIESIFIIQKYIANPLLYITNISTNDNAINVVPKYYEITLFFNKDKIPNIKETAQKIISKYNYNIAVNLLDDTHIKLVSIGVASHAAYPELGNNAISKLIIVINELFSNYNMAISILDDFVTLIGDDFTGTNLKINFEDESGKLTLNTAQFFIDNGNINIGFNLRIPVTIDYNLIEKQFKTSVSNNIEVKVVRIQEPLFISKDNDLVKKLCSIFNEYNNSNIEPQAIGGGTYARAFNNCVSFGPQMPGAKDMCHQVDEFINIEKLMFCVKVYAKAIYLL